MADHESATTTTTRRYWRAVYAAGNARGWRARADELRRQADICDARARLIELKLGIVRDGT